MIFSRFAITGLVTFLVVGNVFAHDNALEEEESENEMDGANFMRNLRAKGECYMKSPCKRTKGAFCTSEGKRCTEELGWKWNKRWCGGFTYGESKRDRRTCGCCLPPNDDMIDNVEEKEIFIGYVKSTDDSSERLSLRFTVDEKRTSATMDTVTGLISVARGMMASVKDTDEYEMVGLSFFNDEKNTWRGDCEASKDGKFQCSFDGRGHLHSKVVTDMIPSEKHGEHKEGDTYFVPSQVAAEFHMEIEIGDKEECQNGGNDNDDNDRRNLEEESTFPLDIPDGKILAQDNMKDKYKCYQMILHKFEVYAKPTQEQSGSGLKDWQLQWEKKTFASAIAALVVPGDLILKHWVPLLEEKRSICVQPVRVRQRECTFRFLGICWSWSYTYSGDGLNFGRPGANEQWAKADVSITWKSWITVNDNSAKYKKVKESEMWDLRNEISGDPECVEVFFVNKFNPSDTYGGGACWGSGTADAYIITSDEQVSCGVDQTHLAHELGHAMGLMHPGTGSATYEDGNTGTLMCPSGWERDNPRRNSKENQNNLQSPLLSCTLGGYTFNSDCQGDASCGTCSEHIPSDSC